MATLNPRTTERAGVPESAGFSSVHGCTWVSAGLLAAIPFPNRMRWPLCLVFVLTLAACSGATSSPRPEGFLYAAPSEAIFVDWAGAGADSGNVEWLTAPDQRRVGAFTVAQAEGGFSFSFEPGTLAGWTGRFDGDGLVLVIPDPTGALRTVAFRPATRAAFDRAAAQVR